MNMGKTAVSWLDRTHEAVLQMVGEERVLINTVKRQINGLVTYCEEILFKE